MFCLFDITVDKRSVMEQSLRIMFFMSDML